MSERAHRMPTLKESAAPKPVDYTGIETQLVEAERAMQEVLADNERLKRRVADLEDKLQRVTAMHNALVAKRNGGKRE